MQKRVSPTDRILPEEYRAATMRLIVGRGVESELLLCALCKLLGEDTCPHRCAKGSELPPEAKRCDTFVINAETHGDVEALVRAHVFYPNQPAG